MASTKKEAVIATFFDSVYGNPYYTTKDGIWGVSYQSVRDGAPLLLFDNYQACQITPNGCSESVLSRLRAAAGQLVFDLKDHKLAKLLRINVPDTYCVGMISEIVPADWSGVPIIDYKTKTLIYKQQLVGECTMPAGATHNIGATACIIDVDCNCVFLVETVGRKGKWCLPGGSYDPKLDSARTSLTTALREAKEEAGWTANISQVEGALVGQLNFPRNQFAPAFNQIWLILCSGWKEWSLDPPKDEINRAQWIPILTIIETVDGTVEGLKLGVGITAAIKAFRENKLLKLVDDKGFVLVYGA